MKVIELYGKRYEVKLIPVVVGHTASGVDVVGNEFTIVLKELDHNTT